jgi:mRNA interferase MazF
VVIQRGEVWWASLPNPRGSGPGYRRPVLVIQSDAFNRSKLQTVLVAVITSNMRLAQAPGNLVLKRRESKLPKDSVVNVSQLITLDQAFLAEKVSKIGADQLQHVEDGLRLVFSL